MLPDSYSSRKARPQQEPRKRIPVRGISVVPVSWFLLILGESGLSLSLGDFHHGGGPVPLGLMDSHRTNRTQMTANAHVGVYSQDLQQRILVTSALYKCPNRHNNLPR